MHRILLDTNAIIYYFNSGASYFRVEVLAQMAESNLYFSPSTLLELEYLYVKKRINASPDSIIGRLEKEIELLESQSTLSDILKHARNLKWTKDPFDRLIVGDTIALEAQLVTSDQLILKNFNQAIW